MNPRELVEKKVKKNIIRNKPKDAEIDEEKEEIMIGKVLNSYIKYQNKKINKYHKEIPIFDMVNYAEKVVLFD